MENYYTIGQPEYDLGQKTRMKYFASPRFNKSRNHLQFHNMNAKFVTGDNVRREKDLFDDEYQFKTEGEMTMNQGHVPKIKDLTFRKEAFTRQSQSEKRNNIKYGVQPSLNTYEFQNPLPRNSKRVTKYKKRRAFRDDTEYEGTSQQSPIQRFSNRKTKKFHGSPTRVKFDMNSSRKENLPK